MKNNVEKIVIEYLSKTAKECCEIVKKGEPISSITESRIGGIPYIPAGKDIPKDSNEEYMEFLMLINLKDIYLDGYPKNGVLEIFLSTAFDLPQEFAIVYFEDNLLARKDLPQIVNKKYEPLLWGSFGIKFKKAIVHMPTCDYRYKSIITHLIEQHNILVCDKEQIENEIFDKLNEIIYKEAAATICGYADFCQFDPRTMDSNQNECFVKINSCLDYDVINIGDSGVLSILCSTESMRNQQFEKMICHWDCL